MLKNWSKPASVTLAIVASLFTYGILYALFVTYPWWCASMLGIYIVTVVVTEIIDTIKTLNNANKQSVEQQSS